MSAGIVYTIRCNVCRKEAKLLGIYTPSDLYGSLVAVGCKHVERKAPPISLLALSMLMAQAEIWGTGR